MSEKQNSVVSIFNTHIEAEDVVRKCRKSVFEMNKLSIAGRDYNTGKNVVG